MTWRAQKAATATATAATTAVPRAGLGLGGPRPAGGRAVAGRSSVTARGRGEGRRSRVAARRGSNRRVSAVSVTRSLLLFVLAALAEIGGAWLVWQGVREHRGVAWIGAGIAALAAYGFVATLQDEAHFGRVLAAYGGIFVAGSLAWGVVADGFRPDRFDLAGAGLCLVGVAVIMYAPR
jgi:small multidrug resistance family-3 protein